MPSISLIRNKRIFPTLIFAAFLLRLPLLFRPAPVFYSRPFIEDAYYSLSVARSLGHGQGLTIDGTHKTNGIQPLIVFLYAPVFALFSDTTALRICLALGILIELLLIFFVRRLLLVMGGHSPRAGTAANVAVFLLLFGYASTVYTLNGLETALATALSLLLALWYYRTQQQEGPPTLGTYAAMGILGGLTVLARIDTAFLIAAICALHILINKRIPFHTRTIQSTVLGSVSLAVSSPWWIYNYTVFGSATPTSGLSQRVVIPFAENLSALVQYILNQALLIGYIPHNRSLTLPHLILAGILVFALVAALLHPRLRQSVRISISALRAQWTFAPMLPLLVFLAAICVYYLFNFGAPHFLQRYLFTGHVLCIAIAAILATEIRERIAALLSPSTMRIVTGCAIALTLAAYSYPYTWNFSSAKAMKNDFLAVSLYISEHIPQTASVGMGQSGTAGFFNRNVVNLDGKVNADVFRAKENGTMCRYLDSSRFDYLIDWQHFFDTIDSCQAFSHYTKMDSTGRFLVYKRK